MTLDGFTETKLIDPFEVFIGPVFEKGVPGERHSRFPSTSGMSSAPAA